MGGSRLWQIVLLWVGLCGAGIAQTVLEAKLQQLPASIGENSVAIRKAGESWVDIGIREFVGFDHLARANPGANIATAPRLFIAGRHQVSGLTANGLVVNIPELMDFRWENGKVVAWYPISVGRITLQWHTPQGTLQVVSRLMNPVWNRPDWAGGGQVPPGPQNPLGDRWIGLNRPGYGLHGTKDPTSIGRIVSHGCMRHFEPHIRQLFDHTTIGMPVMIMYQTVTIGYDNGVVYMAVFPDIYGHGSNTPHYVRQRLASFGLNGALTEPELEQRIAQADGIARPLLGSTTKVSVNLTPLHSPIGPTERHGVTYLPIRTLAAAIKAQVIWDPRTQTAFLSVGKKRIAFPPQSGFTTLDTRFIPIRRAVESLGGAVIATPGKINIFIL